MAISDEIGRFQGAMAVDINGYFKDGDRLGHEVDGEAGRTVTTTVMT